MPKWNFWIIWSHLQPPPGVRTTVITSEWLWKMWMGVRTDVRRRFSVRTGVRKGCSVETSVRNKFSIMTSMKRQCSVGTRVGWRRLSVQFWDNYDKDVQWENKCKEGVQYQNRCESGCGVGTGVRSRFSVGTGVRKGWSVTKRLVKVCSGDRGVPGVQTCSEAQWRVRTEGTEAVLQGWSILNRHRGFIYQNWKNETKAVICSI